MHPLFDAVERPASLAQLLDNSRDLAVNLITIKT